MDEQINTLQNLDQYCEQQQLNAEEPNNSNAHFSFQLKDHELAKN